MEIETATDKNGRYSSSVGATLFKVLLLAIFDAFAVYLVLVLFADGRLVVPVLVAAGSLYVNYVYVSPTRVPAKYLAPGTIGLIVFQLVIVLYTGYIAFTNYGTGHAGDKESAIESLISGGRERVPDSPEYRVTVVRADGELGFLVTDPAGDAFLATESEPPVPVPDANFDAAGKAIETDGWESLQFADLLQIQDELAALEVQATNDPVDGYLRTADGSRAFVYQSKLVYDASTDTIIDTQTGVVYNDNGKGNFESSSGEQISPGWRSLVGGDKFNEVLGSREALSALFGVLWWTFAYAGLSTFLAFSLGTFAAIVFNDPKMRARQLYRVLLLMPYAFPGFLTALVWSGMLNSEFGFINVVLLRGIEIPWFTDPWAARGAVLMVSLWFGYPYMFLVATGALQSIPAEVVEAARVDGASPWQTFRRVKLPLLLVSLSPLLIATFAFNFNNFNIIFLLTKGGPVDLDSPIAAGATDLLITVVYKIAFVDAARDYGLASAYSLVIFVMISAISVVAFRKTKFLEETFD